LPFYAFICRSQKNLREEGQKIVFRLALYVFSAVEMKLAVFLSAQKHFKSNTLEISKLVKSNF